MIARALLAALITAALAAAPAAAQDPLPDPPENPAAGTPPGPTYFGFNDGSIQAWWNDVHRPVKEYPNRGLSLFDNIPWQYRAKANTVRFAVDWRYIEQTDDTFNWGVWGYVYDALTTFGLKPIITVLFAPDRVRDADGCVSAPPVNQHCTGPPKDTPEVHEEIREFTQKVAERMPKAAAIEYWNEPNLGKFFWGGRPPNVEHYTHLLCAAYQGVKQADPTMPVLTGGIAGVKGNTTYETSLLHYLNGIYVYGGRDCFDAVGYHSYTGAEDIGKEGSGHSSRVQTVRNMLTYQGQTNKHIWMTEAGYAGMPQALPQYNIYDEQGQADALRRTYLFFRDQPSVDAVVIHQLLFDTGLNNYEHSYSVLKRLDPKTDWTPRPKLGFCALAEERRGTCDPVTDTTPLAPPPVCKDGRDNDRDGLTDFPDDPGCPARAGDSEADPPPDPDPESG